MTRNKTIALAAAVLWWGLSLRLLFCLSSAMNGTVIITAVLVSAAFIIATICERRVYRSTKSKDDQFLHIQPSVVLIGYMIIQLPICILFGIFSTSVSWKVAILVNIILLGLVLLLFLGSIAGNDHIRKVISRQKNHHTTL